MGEYDTQQVVVGPLRTNTYLIATERGGVVVLDPGADASTILAAVAGRPIEAVVLTHCHFDHVLALPGLLAETPIPVFAHAAEREVWEHEVEYLDTHGHFDAGTMTAELLDRDPGSLVPNEPLWDGDFIPIQDGHCWPIGSSTSLRALHTPGHTPGGLTIDTDGRLFTGDTLFPGGPGLTGWPLSDFSVIMRSVWCLFEQPDATVISPGHGPSTTIGAERPHVGQWADRGW